MSRKINVNPDHYKVAGRQRQGEDIIHEDYKKQYGLAKAAQKGGKKRPGFIPGERKMAMPVAKSSGKMKSQQTRPSRAAAADRASKADRGEDQLSGKRGTRSSAQKHATSRHDTSPMPPTTPVPGAFGKTGHLSEPEREIIDTEPEPEGEGDDFLNKRRRENQKARK